jgi:hypothetical protein
LLIAAGLGAATIAAWWALYQQQVAMNSLPMDRMWMPPPELLADLDTGSLRPAPTERTSSRLAGRSGDLHFTVDHVEDGARSELHFAVEHRSTPDPGAPLRFLVRACDIWHDHLKGYSTACATATLPVVLPLLFTQQPARTTPTRLSMILNVPSSLREILRVTVEVIVLADDFSGSVLDDPVAEPIVLARVELARAFLHAYKNAEWLTEERMKTLAPLLDTLMDQDEPLASNDIGALMTYVVHVFDEASPVRRALEDAIRSKRRVREIYTTIAEGWFAEGRARAMLDVLELRGIAVPTAVRERALAMRDELQIQRCLARALTISTTDDLFDSTET